MTWPAPDLPVSYADETPQFETHPDAHNRTNATLNSDYRPQITANKNDIAQNTTDIGLNNGLITGVDEAWKENEKQRNFDFVRGAAPKVIASPADEITLEAKGVLRATSSGVQPGSIKSTDLATNSLGSDGPLSTSWKTLAQRNMATGKGGNTIFLVMFAADIQCDSNGTVSVGVKTNAEAEPPAHSRAVWRTDFAGRLTVSGHRVITSADGFTFYLQAKGSRATFTAFGGNCHMTVVALHN